MLGLHRCTQALSSFGERGATPCCGAQASHCGDLSHCRARALGMRASVVVACGLSSCGSWALEHRLSSCSAWAQLLRGVGDPPGPGLELVSPALAGGFPTTALPGKPLFIYVYLIIIYLVFCLCWNSYFVHASFSWSQWTSLWWLFWIICLVNHISLFH